MHRRAAVSDATQAVQKLHVVQGVASSTLGARGTSALDSIPMRLQFEYATSKVAAATNTARRSGSPAAVLASGDCMRASRELRNVSVNFSCCRNAEQRPDCSLARSRAQDRQTHLRNTKRKVELGIRYYCLDTAAQ